jgi:Domain of unknown function (DUF5103)
VCCCFAAVTGTMAQDAVYVTNIRTPQLFVFGNQVAFPVMRLNSADQLELHFDDLDADVKAYSYTFQLYNADWTPALLSEFDYIRGFSQIRISDYRLSSVSLTKYTHYRAILPDKSCVPTRSGNYMLKVFLDGDTSKLVFTRRFLVVGNSANVAAEYLQPFNPQVSRTHQKIQLIVNTRSLDISNASQQVKVWVLQNNRWDNAIHDIQPSFSSGNTIEYNSDDGFVFPGGNEWRWLDLQGNFHYQSDRVQKGIYGNTATELLVKPDLDRSRLPYYNYRDFNGMYYIQTTESIHPLWQTDYATVDFFFSTPEHSAFTDKDIYVFGALTGYALDDSTKMKFNEERGMYEASLFLKQGYYNYSFVTIDPHDPARKASFEFTEGNHLETENDYSILVYYRQLGGRADELVAMTKLNSLTGK